MSAPASMRAVTREGDGGPDVLRVADVPVPEIGPEDVLVRVAYAGLNRADLLERAGRYGRVAPAGERPSDGTAIGGIEFAGTVETRGAKVATVKPGDRVCGIATSGAHAGYLAIHARTVARVPDGMPFREAAAIPEAFLTAYDALFARGDFGLGKIVLVHAIGSGAGLAAASLASRAGGVVLGTSRTPEKLERARAFGMREGFANDDGFVAAVQRATEGRGVDLVLDFIGGPELDRNLQALCAGGRIVQIGTLAGTQTPLDLGLLMSKRATVVGTVLRTRGLDEKIQLATALGNRILPSFADGGLRVEIDREFPLDAIADAHRYMESDANFGKVVIAIAPSV